MSRRVELRRAIEAGDGAQVVSILDLEPELTEVRVHRNLKPVLLAAYYRQPKIVDILLDRGATLDVCACATLGKTDGLLSLLGGNLALTKTRSPDGWTPLHLAARFDQIKAAEVLLGHGADVHDASNDWRLTPLHAASSPAMIDTLLRHGADLNAKGFKGWTLLHGLAVRADAALVSFVLVRGADPAAKTKANQTPWSIAVQQGNREVAGILFHWPKGTLKPGT